MKIKDKSLSESILKDRMYKLNIMKKIIYLLLTAVILTGCALNILTGRKQLNLVQESELQLMAKEPIQYIFIGE